MNMWHHQVDSVAIDWMSSIHYLWQHLGQKYTAKSILTGNIFLNWIAHQEEFITHTRFRDFPFDSETVESWNLLFSGLAKDRVFHWFPLTCKDAIFDKSQKCEGSNTKRHGSGFKHLQCFEEKTPHNWTFPGLTVLAKVGLRYSSAPKDLKCLDRDCVFLEELRSKCRKLGMLSTSKWVEGAWPFE